MDLKGQFLHRLLTNSGRAYAMEVAADLTEGDRLHGMPYLDVVGDTANRLAALGAALSVGRIEAWVLEICWAQRLFDAREVPHTYLEHNLQAIRRVLESQLPVAEVPIALQGVDAALDVLSKPHLPLHEHQTAAEILARESTRDLLQALLHGRRSRALALADEIAAGTGGRRLLLLEVLPAVQREIGRLWQGGEIDVAEEHLGSRIVEEILSRGAFAEPGADPAGESITVLAAAVSGNDHDIGLRIVADLLRSEGIEVLLLGANTPASTIYRSCEDYAVDVLAVSATMLVHLPQAADLIAGFASSDLRPPVIVGGPLFAAIPDLYRDLGADAGVADLGDLAAAVRALAEGSAR